ncbi:MAG TPA: M3 family metallopeptidase [Saprospiraceae bacterium]|nr:M3 family metallopeptidase [Saprospiraceae bacterium]
MFKNLPNPFKALFLLVLILLIGVSCTSKKSNQMQDNNANTDNVLLKPWTGPYNGLPPLDKIKASDFKPALLTGMTADSIEISKISANPEPANFKNTIEAMELTGDLLTHVVNLYNVWSSNMSTPDFQKVDTEMQPKIAAFYDKIYQDEALFKRIETVYNSAEKKTLNPEQQRLVWKYYTDFVYYGAKMNAENKKKVAEINQKLASLNTKFNQNLLADESGFMELSEADVKGLPDAVKESSAQMAKGKNKTGWLVANTRSSIEPFLTYCTNRALREKAWRMFINRGDNGDAHDNNAIITQILQLRAERAKLLGFATHAHWKLSNKMAKDPEKALDLLQAVWKPAVNRVHEEVADMQKLADKEKAGIKIEAWDYRYYAEKVRKEKYDLDENEVKPYMQLEKLREGMFWMAGELFNFEFTQVKDVPVNHPDVRVWKVSDKTTGKQVGLWYFDPYAREGKRSGAWMTAYLEQSKLKGDVTTIVSNNSNFIKGKEGEPVLISFEDASTLFHEFGHALHGLSSNVTYVKLSGTNVATDYVEFPSQILEHWLTTPEILNKFAVHYKTGKPIPQDLVKRIENAAKFNQGFKTVEYLSSALIDMKLHLAGNQKIDPDAFEKKELTALGMPKEMVMRHRTPQFGHIFADDQYSAGYYSYLWAEVLSADAYEAFLEAGGPYDKAVAKRLREHVFSVGGTVDEAEAYKAFRGKDPSIAALMKDRGFPYKGK